MTNPLRQQSGPTPPHTVARAAQPSLALTAFIGQELEKWGFGLDETTPGRLLVTAADGRRLSVAVTDYPSTPRMSEAAMKATLPNPDDLP